MLRRFSWKAEEDFSSVYNEWNESFDRGQTLLLFFCFSILSLLEVCLPFIVTPNTFCDKWKLQKTNRGRRLEKACVAAGSMNLPSLMKAGSILLGVASGHRLRTNGPAV